MHNNRCPAGPPAARPYLRFAAPILLALVLAWAYWPTLTSLAERWTYEPQYSHGYLVPLFAGLLLWQRREDCPTVLHGSPSGLLVLGAGLALWLSGAYVQIPGLEAVSLLACLVGGVLVVGGWPALRWSWPALAFLLFMFPLPARMEGALAQPLQRLATQASTAALIICGLPATAEGNIIAINESQIGVAEACSGLSMLLTFFAIAVGCALLIRRPLLDRVVLVLAAIPIALVANVVRITITGILYETASRESARLFFHDLAGWFMIAFALGLVWLIVEILNRLLIEPPEPTPLPVR